MQNSWVRRNQFFLCLEELIGLPIQGRSLDDEWKDFVGENGCCKNQIKHVNETARMNFDNIPDTDKSLGLTEEEVKCILLYTFKSKYEHPYSRINQWLQDTNRVKGKFTRTVTNIYTGFVKLSKKSSKGALRRTRRSSCIYGRVSSYLTIPGDPIHYETDETGFRGFLCYNFSSCTTNLDTFESFLSNSTGTGYEILEREEDEGGIHKGVQLPSYLSYDPSDEIVLFPPLTLFKILCDYKEGGSIVYIVEPLYRSVVHLPLIEPNDTIWKAIRNNDLATVSKWLKSYPSVNLEHVHDKYGCCLLYSACRYGHVDIVKALVERCSNVDSQVSNKRSTALQVACFNGKTEVVKYLLSQGANTTLTNDYNFSPIAETSNEDIRLLLKEANDRKCQEDTIEGKMIGTLLVYGDRLSYIRGMKEFLGNPIQTAKKEFLRNINFTERYSGKGIQNTCKLWNSAEAHLETLRQKPEAADLNDEELIALYLYTGPSYQLVNDFLRQLQLAENTNNTTRRIQLLSKEYSWVATILSINAAIRKLCTNAKRFPVTYRGVGGSLKPNFFVPDKRGLIAATEYGFMSTTEDYNRALNFTNGALLSTVFVIKCRQEDAGGYHMGAHLEWCTMFEGENEVLFPPLTMFEILDRYRENNITTITVAPNFI